MRRQSNQITWSKQQAWAAAVVVDHAQQGYFKESTYDNNQQPPVLIREANKAVLYRMINENKFEPTAEELAAGIELQQYWSQFLTMATLKGTVSDFQRTQIDIVQTEQFTERDIYRLAILASMPESRRRQEQREAQDARLRGTRPLTAMFSEKIRTAGEVIRSVYSEKWNTFYITVITGNDEQVFFAYKKALPVGDRIEFSGRVKRHSADSTQLNRVTLQ
jgi:hypothetical protein